MIIKCIGGPVDGQTVTVELSPRGEPPETIMIASAGLPFGSPYRVHRCNDPFTESWWWAYVAYALYPSDITEQQIAASRPTEGDPS